MENSPKPRVENLYIAPGNAGTSRVGTNVALSATDFPALKEFALAHAIDMVVVGPEDPLVKGVYDFFKNDAQLASIPVIGRRPRVPASKEVKTLPKPS